MNDPSRSATYQTTPVHLTSPRGHLAWQLEPQTFLASYCLSLESLPTMPRHAPLRCLLAFNLAAFAANITTNADPATLASATSTATIPAVPCGASGTRPSPLTLTAQGVQIYKCLPVAGNPSRYEWGVPSARGPTSSMPEVRKWVIIFAGTDLGN